MELSELMAELYADPTAQFEFSATLPSGNVMIGKIGPIVGNRLACAISFEHDPSESDIDISKKALDLIVGEPPTIVLRSDTPEERAANRKTVAKFMKGGIQ